jgi:DNA-directed RNA polymerase subunit RPC12/RpoP
MKEHKSERHDYCARCDEDFESEEHLLIHKIKSQKHIVCPICGCEFRSEGGRDLHVRQVCKRMVGLFHREPASGLTVYSPIQPNNI